MDVVVGADLPDDDLINSSGRILKHSSPVVEYLEDDSQTENEVQADTHIFTPFPKLPPELRSKIWRYAL